MAKLELPAELSVVLYGDTGHGKSTLVAELATELKVQHNKRTVVFLADKGSAKPYRLLVKHGVVELLEPKGNAWLWVNHALRGEVRVEGKDNKQYRSVAQEDVGLIVHEGLTAYAELLMSSLASMSANGTNVGGEGAWNVVIREGVDTLKLAPIMGWFSCRFVKACWPTNPTSRIFIQRASGVARVRKTRRS